MLYFGEVIKIFFNQSIFDKLVERAYGLCVKANPNAYSLEDVLSVFHYYLKSYENKFYRSHPNIRLQQIIKVVEIMPFVDDFFVSVSDYSLIINRHFNTQYLDCDFNINHFFSGDIRLFRYYEVFE